MQRSGNGTMTYMRGLCPWHQAHPFHSYKFLTICTQIQLSFAHITKWWWWISPQMMEVAILNVQENKSKPKEDQWQGSYSCILHWSLLLWSIRHPHPAKEPERFPTIRDWEQIHPCVTSVSRIQQAQVNSFSSTDLTLLLRSWFKWTTKTQPPPQLFSPQKNTAIPSDVYFSS